MYLFDCTEGQINWGLISKRTFNTWALWSSPESGSTIPPPFSFSFMLFGKSFFRNPEKTFQYIWICSKNVLFVRATRYLQIILCASKFTFPRTFVWFLLFFKCDSLIQLTQKMENHIKLLVNRSEECLQAIRGYDMYWYVHWTPILSTNAFQSAK